MRVALYKLKPDLRCRAAVARSAELADSFVMPIVMTVAIERFALTKNFVISRGAKSHAEVVTVEISADGHCGHGECVPYARYGESPDGVVAAITGLRAAVEAGMDRQDLQGLLPAGAARNALDCALWDLEAKSLGLRAHVLAGLHRLAPATTAFTISVGSPQDMALAARAAGERHLLKIKLAGDGDMERIAAVREAAPDAELIVDANEAWREADLAPYFDACRRAGIALIEQPLPAGRDAALALRPRDIPVCADESVHDRQGLAALRPLYDAINIKLDKAGGLTEALLLAGAAEQLGFALVVGSMVGSSLAMAPAMLLAARARYVDLDGPLLLARDRSPGLRFTGSVIEPPGPEVWG